MRAVFALAVLATALAATPAIAVPVAHKPAGDGLRVLRVADLDWAPRARRRHQPRAVRDCVAGRYRHPWLLRRHVPLAREERRLGTPDYIYYPEQYFCLYPRYERR